MVKIETILLMLTNKIANDIKDILEVPPHQHITKYHNAINAKSAKKKND
jgi:hypothetical protein